MRTAFIAATYEEGRLRADELGIAPLDRVIVTPSTHPGAVAGMVVDRIETRKATRLSDINQRTAEYLKGGLQRGKELGA